MTLSTLQQLSGPDQAPGQNGNGGYSPDQAQALILHPQNEKGGYVDYLRTVRHLVDPEMRTLSAYVRGGHYRTDILRDLGHRYYHHTQWQIRSQSSMLNHRRMALLKEKAWIESMLLGFQKTIDTAEVAAMEQRPRTALRETALSYSASTLKADEHRPITAIIPVTLGEAYDRLTEIMMLVQSLALRIRRAQERDIYYDVGPAPGLLADSLRAPRRPGPDPGTGLHGQVERHSRHQLGAYLASPGAADQLPERRRRREPGPGSRRRGVPAQTKYAGADIEEIRR